MSIKLLGDLSHDPLITDDCPTFFMSLLRQYYIAV